MDAARDDFYFFLKKDSIAKDNAALVHLFELYFLMVRWCCIAFKFENEQYLERYICLTCNKVFSKVNKQIATFYHNSNFTQLTKTYPVISCIHLKTKDRTNIPKEGCDISHNA